jgi:hypothetical protein
MRRWRTTILAAMRFLEPILCISTSLTALCAVALAFVLNLIRFMFTAHPSRLSSTWTRRYPYRAVPERYLNSDRDMDISRHARERLAL